MNEEHVEVVEESATDEEDIAILELLQMQTPKTAQWTIVYAIIGAIIYVGIAAIPLPYTMVSLFQFGLLPSIAVIGVVGAHRGPMAGFLSGYLGVILYDLIFTGLIVTMTLPAVAYGVLGLVIGLPRYQFDNGRSLGKLSLLSVVGFVFTTLLVVVIGITVESYSTLVAIGFVMLPMLTVGLPSALLLTPVFARIWYEVTRRIGQESEE